jgi:hypothetical protein
LGPVPILNPHFTIFERKVTLKAGELADLKRLNIK